MCDQFPEKNIIDVTALSKHINPEQIEVFESIDEKMIKSKMGQFTIDVWAGEYYVAYCLNEDGNVDFILIFVATPTNEEWEIRNREKWNDDKVRV